MRCRSCDSPRSYLRVSLRRRAASFMTLCNLSVTDLGVLANTVLQKSTRVVTKAWTIVFMHSSSKDRRTRTPRSWWSKVVSKTVETCLSRRRSHEKVTYTSTRTWSTVQCNFTGDGKSAMCPLPGPAADNIPKIFIQIASLPAELSPNAWTPSTCAINTKTLCSFCKLF